MSRSEDEDGLFRVVSSSLKRWLGKAKSAVFANPSRPDPNRVYGLQSDWDSEVDTILSEIGKIGMRAWSDVPDAPPVSRMAFMVSYLADVKNLLVRIPHEVADLIFAEINDGASVGESTDQIAARVDRVLTYTGSERWPNRARVIAQTETTRARAAGTMAAGVEMSRVTGQQLTKRWDTKDDARVRTAHMDVDGKTIPVWQTFYVGGFPMMFPGDPSAPADLVINCRCELHIGREARRG